MGNRWSKEKINAWYGERPWLMEMCIRDRSRNSKLNPDKAERIPGIIGIGMGVSCSYNEGIPFFQQIIFSGDMEEAAAVEQEMNGEIGIVGISL